MFILEIELSYTKNIIFPNLTNLVYLSLYGNQLRVPDDAPLDSSGAMYYINREAVAAFQACLN